MQHHCRLITLLLVVLPFLGKAQSPQTRVTINGTDEWNNLTDTEQLDGDYFVAGYSAGPSAPDHVIVSRVTPSGEVVWIYDDETDNQVGPFDISAVGEDRLIVATTETRNIFDADNYHAISLRTIQLSGGGYGVSTQSFILSDTAFYSGLRGEFVGDSVYVMTASIVRNLSRPNCSQPMIIKSRRGFTEIERIPMPGILEYGCYEIRDVKYFSDNEIIVQAFTDQDDPSTEIFSFSIDQTLNWRTTISYGAINRVRMIEQDDEGHIILGGVSTTLDDDGSMTFFRKHDAAGVLIDSTLMSHGDTTVIMTDGHRRQDGTFVTVSYYLRDGISYNIGYSILNDDLAVIKSDFVPLERPVAYEFPRGIFSSADGRLAITGEYTTDSSTDPNGLLVLVECDLLSDVSSPTGATNNTLQVYPNPTGDSFTVKFGEYGRHEVRVVNGVGREVCRKIGFGDTVTIDNSDLTSGIYFVVASDETGKYRKQVLIKQR